MNQPKNDKRKSFKNRWLPVKKALRIFFNRKISCKYCIGSLSESILSVVVYVDDYFFLLYPIENKELATS